MEASNVGTEVSAENKEPLVEQVLLFKTSEQRWGFRLTGGADFGTPITVIKVTAGGVAARAGLRVGDLLLGVDEVSLATMTHDAASKLVLDRGDKLTVTLVRGTFEMPALPPRQTPALHDPVPAATTAGPILGDPLAPEELPPLLAQIISEGEQLNEPIAEQSNEAQPITEQQDTTGVPPEPITELSGPDGAQGGPIIGEAVKESDVAQVQAEVPQAGALEQPGTQQGEALTSTGEVQGEGEPVKVEYTEEEIAEMISGCAEVLQGSVIGVDFQKLPPDTDIMKSKVLDAILTEKLGPPPKKPTTFNQKPTNPRPKTKQELEPRPPPYDPRKYVCQKKKEEPPAEQQVAEETQLAPNEAEQPTEASEATEPSEQPEQSTDAPETAEKPSESTEVKEQVTEEEQPPEEEQVVASTELEQQLGEIQRQLAAIIQLPAEIQQHLTFIQEQLAKVLAQRKAEEEAAEQEGVEQPQEEGAELQGDEEPIVEEPGEEDAVEEVAEEVCEVVETEPEEPVQEEVVEEVPEVPVGPKRDIEWAKPPPPPRRPFFPLTPAPRPLRLPAGRIWSAPRDVYTEQFIADTLSGHEEVLADGHTLGVDFHKFDLGYEHLKNSPVYALVHEQEDGRAPAPRRLSKAHAAQDYVIPTSAEP